MAEREAKEREEKRKSVLYRVANAGQDSRWQHYSVIRAKTERSKTIALKKQWKLDDEVAAARAAAFEAGFTEAEIDKAQRGY